MKKDRIMRRGARGSNFQGMAEAADDLRQHVEIGRVRAEGGDTHWEIEGGQVWVDCVLMPTEQPVTCRLTTVAGGPGKGIWMVPPDDAEVVIAFPNGDITGGGIIIAVLPGGDVNAGVQEDNVVIIGAEVMVYDADSGEANPLPTLAEFNNHTHPSGMGPTGTPTTPATGTTVLKAK